MYSYEDWLSAPSRPKSNSFIRRTLQKDLEKNDTVDGHDHVMTLKNCPLSTCRCIEIFPYMLGSDVVTTLLCTSGGRKDLERELSAASSDIRNGGRLGRLSTSKGIAALQRGSKFDASNSTYSDEVSDTKSSDDRIRNSPTEFLSYL
ncbi:hypothetical protein OIDMADRAFT_35953 [Oidiodendron maius Zn]|uniref:Uncharacterized protein n=1 Tax=Oidiodendron maius (strain Zn) TaxID=913774 RepID=A0A0C3CUB4_OIDMZ|nr:hypothetical protein OIDMADRAFT_35953 [Oidiodendron maius Zn]